ncbi:uncharacterized protein LOC123427344 isoform X2 [Hordeum vulgare subsp. vulgare]|uniref:uncharacterized protein LOC123427344 isoform X2 n=1 Tax=Hordeum vulgare subsp. vulgare TaxID=112509 RepID=UPI001D1A5161|nr:uncharacterized protein LOC123427344 isoform X2 [Hordeum vulgare subsp. vulgare]
MTTFRLKVHIWCSELDEGSRMASQSTSHDQGLLHHHILESFLLPRISISSKRRGDEFITSCVGSSEEGRRQRIRLRDADSGEGWPAHSEPGSPLHACQRRRVHPHRRHRRRRFRLRLLDVCQRQSCFDHPSARCSHGTQCGNESGAGAKPDTLHCPGREPDTVGACRSGAPSSAAATCSGAGIRRTTDTDDVSGLLPVDPRRPAAMASHGDHARGVGRRPPVRRQVPGHGALRAALRGALRAVLPDAGRVHAVGHPAAAPPLRRPRPRPRPHVRLPGPAGRQRRRPRQPHAAAAAAVPVLRQRAHAGHRLPGLVLLGPELNIKPWEALRREIKEANAALDWTRRAPYAYWKGNPAVAAARRELLKCNVSGKRDWNARIYAQDWRTEVRGGFRESDLAKQCTHRYKMYVEGRGWSVSEKYILACDSVALVVRPRFHDFFSRGLVPLQHYWPVRGDRGQCRSIKFAVDWGNSHPHKAREIGENASRFVQEELTMDRVYDYMYHLLSEYARLLRYTPTVPGGAVEVTARSMARGRRGLEREFMVGTAVDAPGSAEPCELPSPFGPEELEALRRRNADAVRRVETWEER